MVSVKSLFSILMFWIFVDMELKVPFSLPNIKVPIISLHSKRYSNHPSPIRMINSRLSDKLKSIIGLIIQILWSFMDASQIKRQFTLCFSFVKTEIFTKGFKKRGCSSKNKSGESWGKCAAELIIYIEITSFTETSKQKISFFKIKSLKFVILVWQFRPNHVKVIFAEPLCIFLPKSCRKNNTIIKWIYGVWGY